MLRNVISQAPLHLLPAVTLRSRRDKVKWHLLGLKLPVIAHCGMTMAPAVWGNAKI